jgi:integrase
LLVKDSTTTLCLAFLILNAMRGCEVLGLKWSEVDLTKRLIVIPATKMNRLTNRSPCPALNPCGGTTGGAGVTVITTTGTTILITAGTTGTTGTTIHITTGTIIPTDTIIPITTGITVMAMKTKPLAGWHF